MTVAVADAPPPPVPALGRPDCATAKALTYLCLASLWVGGAGVAAAAFADLAWAGGAYGVGTPLVSALLKLSTDAVFFGALLAFVVLMLLLRAALRLLATGLIRFRFDMAMGTNKIPGESVGSMLRDTGVIGWLASLPFAMLSVIGCVVMFVLSPAKGSLTGRIGIGIIDVGVLGSMVLSCCVTIPSMALKLWRMSPSIEGHAPADSIV